MRIPLLVHPQATKVCISSSQLPGDQIKNKMNIPDWLKCPISLELFRDPVTLSTGQTYDRANIEKWFAYGNVTCPVTMQRLHDASLVPNRTLRHLIERTWCLSDSRPQVDSVQLSLSTLKQNLQTPTSAATKLETLGLIRVLSSESSGAQVSLVRSGFFELLLQFLFQVHLAQNSELIGSALDCILNLWPYVNLESLDMLKREPRQASLEHLLSHGNSRIKISLCHMVEAIATCNTMQELSHLLAHRQRLLKALVSLMLDKSDARASEAALRAVCGLCSLLDNRASAIREGAVDGIVSYLSTAATHLSGSRHQTVTRALAALELLVGFETGKREMSKNQNAIVVLVKMVFRVSADQEGSEHAVGALLMVCRDSAQARVDAINAGLLTQLLLLLQSQSSPKAKYKARALLKLLRSMDGGG